MANTPTEIPNVSTTRPPDLLRIGLSVSNSPDDERAARGWNRQYLEDVFLDIARGLLAGGANLAYGGDLRPGGFSRQLFDWLSTLRPADRPAPQRIVHYLAWPTYLALAAEDREQLGAVVRIVEVPPPGVLNVDTSHCLSCGTAADRHTRSRCLTAMRIRMNDETDARVVIGGAVTGYLGRYPGVAEEGYLALNSGKPVYLIGGFGGCAAMLSEALCGGDPAIPPAQYPLPSNLLYAETPAPEPPDSSAPADYPTLLGQLRQIGMGNLNNGLSPEENHRLSVTTNAPEALALIERGLQTLHPEKYF